MQAAILSIGDELTLGQTVDTNTAYLAARLAERGILAPLHFTVADDRRSITDAFHHAAQTADLIIATGGLGPTDDDLTRFALADALGVDLTLDEPSLRDIQQFFVQRDRPMSERNRLQAMGPAGAAMLRNPAGTAPGIHARLGDADVYCIPGVPVEMKTLYDLHIAPALPHQTGRVIRATTIHTFGAGESDVADRIAPLTSRTRNPLVGTTVSGGLVSVRIRAESPSADEAQQQLDRTAAEAERLLHPLAFGRNDQTLTHAVGRILSDRHQTLATAESCTAGLLGKQITDVPGSGDYYLGGWITYSYGFKHRQLDIPLTMLEEHGAVSEPVALAMADHARKISEADYALAITGLAGPEGGTAEKPVGTVWIALADRNATTVARRHLFPGDRPTIRDRSAKAALNMLRLRLLQ